MRVFFFFFFLQNCAFNFDFDRQELEDQQESIAILDTGGAVKEQTSTTICMS